MEQGTGVEPASAAWEAAVLPMYEPCVSFIIAPLAKKCKRCFMTIPHGKARIRGKRNLVGRPQGTGVFMGIKGEFS